MKVLVGVKRVVDYAVKVRVAGGTVDLANVKQSMNPFCEVRRTVSTVADQALYRLTGDLDCCGGSCSFERS